MRPNRDTTFYRAVNRSKNNQGECETCVLPSPNSTTTPPWGWVADTRIRSKFQVLVLQYKICYDEFSSVQFAIGKEELLDPRTACWSKIFPTGFICEVLMQVCKQDSLRWNSKLYYLRSYPYISHHHGKLEPIPNPLYNLSHCSPSYKRGANSAISLGYNPVYMPPTKIFFLMY